MFYKNVIFVLPLYYFGFYSGFTGTNFYDPWMYQTFNVVMTGLPICWFGVFDWIQIPHEEPQKENRAMNQEHANSDIKPVLKSTKTIHAGSEKQVKFTDQAGSPVTKTGSKTE